LPHRPEKAAQALLDAVPEWSATAHYVVEHGNSQPPLAGYATFAIGVGFDAEVVAAAETRPSSKLHFGSLHYAGTTAAKLFSGYKHKPPTLRVESEGRRVDAVSVLVAAHSPYTYFGAVPLRLAPGKADGLVAIAIERLGPWRAVDLLVRAIAGRRIEHRDVHVWRDFGKLIIEAEPAGAIQADGEGMGLVDAVEIAPAPASLLVLTPRL
jgi:diacylglycerol kinase family enzyme